MNENTEYVLAYCTDDEIAYSGGIKGTLPLAMRKDAEATQYLAADFDVEVSIEELLKAGFDSMGSS